MTETNRRIYTFVTASDTMQKIDAIQLSHGIKSKSKTIRLCIDAYFDRLGLVLASSIKESAPIETDGINGNASTTAEQS